MKKKFQIINIILLICAISCLVFYDIHGGLWLKGVTSSWFVLLGFINLLYAKKNKVKNFHFVVTVFIGLFLGMCADVLLGINFIVGVLSFALGHVAYLIAYYGLEKFDKKELFVIIPISLFSLYIVACSPFITIEDPLLEKALLGYAIIISCMLSKAITNYIKEKTTFRFLILIGSILFYFSDIMLAFDMFGESTRLLWILCSYTYWPAQNILAHSLFHYTNTQNEK